MTTELEMPVKSGGYNLSGAIAKAEAFRRNSFPIGIVHRSKEFSGTGTFLRARMLKQLGMPKFVSAADSRIEAIAYNRFHKSDTLVDIVPNMAYCLSNPLKHESDTEIDNYILNNALYDKPRIYLGHSALSLLKEGTCITERPYEGIKNKINMFLTPMAEALFPEAVEANTDCNGNIKAQYVINMDNCLILRNFIQDDAIVPLAYINRPTGQKNKPEKHIVAFYYKDTNSIGVLYNPERTIHDESSREFQNTGMRHGCAFFMSVLKNMLLRASNDNAISLISQTKTNEQ